MTNRPQTNRRRRTTSRRVYVADAVAGSVISVGGLAVVAAVLGICVYLIVVAGRLFLPGSVGERAQGSFAAGADGAPWRGDNRWFVQPDEHLTSLVALDREGNARFVDIKTGAEVSATPVTPEGRRITALARAPRDGLTAIGLDDGSVILGKIGVGSRFLTGADADAPALAPLTPGETGVFERAIAARTPIGQIRLAEPAIQLSKPTMLPSGEGAVTLLDYQATSSAEYLVAIRADGSAQFDLVRKTTPLGGGPPRVTLEERALPFQPPAGKGLPRWLFVTGDGSSVLTLWDDGVCQRYFVGEAGATLAETATLLDAGRRVTAATLLIGAKTLVLGDDAGAVYGCFVARDPGAPTPDRSRLVRAHALAPHDAPVVAIGVSERDRTFVTADARGGVVVRNMTSHKTVARLRAAEAGAAHVRLAPKGDAVLAFGAGDAFERWALEQGHPDSTVGSLFGKVWYEGEPGPAHVYQSSSGDDASEAKIGLTPLIWGTLKATVFAMLVATPLAILAAIFTSEFLGRRARAVVKPVIETMASLPSVVLGFLAAIVLAPALARALPGVLLAFVLVPIAALLGAHLWHFVPTRVSAGVSAKARLGMLAVTLLISGAASLGAGPAVERALFRPTRADLAAMAGRVAPLGPDETPAWVGSRESFTPAEQRRLRADGLRARDGAVVRPDPGAEPTESLRAAAGPNAAPSLRSWLDGVYGEAWPGWLAIGFPFVAATLALASVRLVDPRLARLETYASGRAAAAVELFKFLALLALTGAGALGLALALQALGLDPRDSLLGPFDQRNTMVVAIVMSVAIVPIIYTICDDAMMSVPEPLRSASLAAGATRWQTAVRISLPVAASGVFSACMIGLGRAAGETMIVLMATGNTPVMSLSLFDGMRTLSANIATELPEAAKDSSHYRMLFLCGLVLFAMTFAINTVAEAVRQRFRRRSAAL